MIERISAGEVNINVAKPVFETHLRSIALAVAEIKRITIDLTPIAYGTVTGTVYDADTGKRLSEATVNVSGTIVITDAQGHYVLERVMAGGVVVSAAKFKYLDTQVSVELAPAGNIEAKVGANSISRRSLTAR